MNILSILGMIVGGPLSVVLKIYKILRDLPDFWLLVKNYDQVALIWQDLEDLGKSVYKKRKVDISDVGLMADAMERALKLKLIDLPFVDESELGNALHEIKNSLDLKVVQANPDLIKREVDSMNAQSEARRGWK